MACFTKVFKREKKSYDLPVVAVLNVERTPQEFSVIISLFAHCYDLRMN